MIQLQISEYQLSLSYPRPYDVHDVRFDRISKFQCLRGRCKYAQVANELFCLSSTWWHSFPELRTTKDPTSLTAPLPNRSPNTRRAMTWSVPLTSHNRLTPHCSSGTHPFCAQNGISVAKLHFVVVYLLVNKPPLVSTHELNRIGTFCIPQGVQIDIQLARLRIWVEWNEALLAVREGRCVRIVLGCPVSVILALATRRWRAPSREVKLAFVGQIRVAVILTGSGRRR